MYYTAVDILISVVDHQRAFIVHICTQHLMLYVQDTQAQTHIIRCCMQICTRKAACSDWVAWLSRTQLVNLCTGVWWNKSSASDANID